jgi:hypothetical protein
VAAEGGPCLAEWSVPMSLYTRVIPADSPLTLVYPGFAFASLSLASEEPYPSYAG